MPMPYRWQLRLFRSRPSLFFQSEPQRHCRYIAQTHDAETKGNSPSRCLLNECRGIAAGSVSDLRHFVEVNSARTEGGGSCQRFAKGGLLVNASKLETCSGRHKDCLRAPYKNAGHSVKCNMRRRKE